MLKYICNTDKPAILFPNKTEKSKIALYVTSPLVSQIHGVLDLYRRNVNMESNLVTMSFTGSMDIKGCQFRGGSTFPSSGSLIKFTQNGFKRSQLVDCLLSAPASNASILSYTNVSGFPKLLLDSLRVNKAISAHSEFVVGNVVVDGGIG